MPANRNWFRVPFVVSEDINLIVSRIQVFVMILLKDLFYLSFE